MGWHGLIDGSSPPPPALSHLVGGHVDGGHARGGGRAERPHQHQGAWRLDAGWVCENGHARVGHSKTNPIAHTHAPFRTSMAALAERRRANVGSASRAALTIPVRLMGGRRVVWGGHNTKGPRPTNATHGRTYVGSHRHRRRPRGGRCPRPPPCAAAAARAPPPHPGGDGC